MRPFHHYLLAATLLSVAQLSYADIPPAIQQLDVADELISALSLSGNRIAVGQPGVVVNGVANAGQVRWHDANSGRLLRTFVSPAPTDSQEFGAGVALMGDRLIVGAPGTSQVFVFSTRNGALLDTISNPSARFGASIAVSGGYALVGAPGHNFSRGAVYAIDLYFGAPPILMFASDGSIGDALGTSIATSGGLVVAGAPGANADTGCAYLFDWTTGYQINKLLATDSAPGNRYGTSVALRGTRAYVGAPGGQFNRGGVYEVDAPNSLELRIYVDPVGSANDRFGASMSQWGNLLVVGAPAAGAADQGTLSFFDIDDGSFRGTLERADIPGQCETGNLVALDRGRLAVYTPFPAAGDVNLCVYNGLVGSLGGRIEVSQNYPMLSGTARAGAPIQAVVDSLGNALATSRFTPPRGSGIGNILLLAGDPLAPAEAAGFAPSLGARVTGFPLLFTNQNSYQMFGVSLSGSGINANNNFHLFSTSGFTFTTGTAIDGLAPALVSRAHQVRQASDTLEKQWGMLFGLRRQAGLVTATDDTGVRVANDLNQSLFVVREGDLAPLEPMEDPPDAVTYGEFAKRLAVNPDAVFSAALVGGPSGTRQGVFRRTIPGLHRRIARQGNEAEGTGGGTFASFTGETASSVGWVVFRATVRGSGINARNNEGLWRKLPTFARVLVARKGDPVPEIPGATWNRFLGYWPIGNQVLIYARIAGPGIKAKNDTALLLLQENDTWKLLLREGYGAPGCPDAALSVIQHIEVDANSGSYAVTAALSGPAAENQAVFVGATNRGIPFNSSGERIPHLLMRKGTPHQAPFAAPLGTVRSLRVPGPTPDRTGAGGIGNSSAINGPGQLFLDVDYGRSNRHLIRTQLP